MKAETTTQSAPKSAPETGFVAPVIAYRPTRDMRTIKAQAEIVEMAVHPASPQLGGGVAHCSIYYAGGTVDSHSISYGDEQELFNKINGELLKNKEREQQQYLRMQANIKEMEAKELGTPSIIAGMKKRLSQIAQGEVYAAQHLKLIIDNKASLLQGRISGTNSVRMPDTVTVLAFPNKGAVDNLNTGSSCESIRKDIKTYFGEDIVIREVKPIEAMPIDGQRRVVIPEWVIVG